MSNPKHVLVFGSIGNSDVGDDAYVIASIDHLEKRLKDVDWVILSSRPEETESRCKRPSQLGFLRADPPGGKGLGIIYWRSFRQLLESLLYGLFPGKGFPLKWFSSRTKQLIRSIQKADIVVCLGGGSLNGDYRKAFISEVVFLWLCKRMKKPVAMVGQSLGPLYGPVSQSMAARALKGINALTLREPGSLDLAKHIGVVCEHIEMTMDSAFLLPQINQEEAQQTLRELNVPKNSVVIGISVRKWFYPGLPDPQGKHENYVKAVSAAADSLVENLGCHVLLIPTEVKDPIACREVLAAMNRAGAARIAGDGNDLSLIRKSIQGCDMFISTRFHPLAFATMAGIPVLAISYTRKCKDYMCLLERDDLCCDIEDVSKQWLETTCQDVWKKRKDESAHLADKARYLRQKALRNIDVIVDMANYSHEKL